MWPPSVLTQITALTVSVSTSVFPSHEQLASWTVKVHGYPVSICGVELTPCAMPRLVHEQFPQVGGRELFVEIEDGTGSRDTSDCPTATAQNPGSCAFVISFRMTYSESQRLHITGSPIPMYLAGGGRLLVACLSFFVCVCVWGGNSSSSSSSFLPSPTLSVFRILGGPREMLT